MKRRRTGFTLMEVLLALALMSVVAVALFTSLRTAFKAKRSAEAAMEVSRQGEIAMELIRADLESALPPRGSLASDFNGRDWSSATGSDDDDLTFYSAAPAPPNVVRPPDIKEIELIIVTLEGTGERVLARRVTGDLLSTALIDPNDEVLCRNVAGFNLSYFDGTEWWSSWDSRTEDDALPVAVEVTLDIDPPQSRIDAGNYAPIRFTRVIHLPCNGVIDNSELPEETTDGTEAGGSNNPSGGENQGGAR